MLYNTYIFELIDENNNVIDTRKVHNMVMKDKYEVDMINKLGAGDRTLSFCFGTMYSSRDGSSSDYYRYQTIDKNGNRTWKVDTVVQPKDGYIGDTNSVEVNTGGNYFFHPKIKKTDTNLFGTMAFSQRLNFEHTDMSLGRDNKYHVTLKAQCEWGYHDTSNRLNAEHVVGYESGTVQTITISGSGVIESEEEKIPQRVYGIYLLDAGVFGGGIYDLSTMLTHFLITTDSDKMFIKRPTDKLRITVIVNYKVSKLNNPLQRDFHPLGNLCLGNQTFNFGNIQYNNIPKTKPLALASSLILTGLPIEEAENGFIMPIADCNRGISIPIKTIVTDPIIIPVRKEKNEKGELVVVEYNDTEKAFNQELLDNDRQYPMYYYYGNDENIYEKQLSEEGETYVLDKYSRRKIQMSKLTTHKSQYYKDKVFGPIKTIILPSVGAQAISGSSTVADGIKISSYYDVPGTNKRRFYHPFMETDAQITQVRCVSNQSVNAEEIVITYYEPGASPFYMQEPYAIGKLENTQFKPIWTFGEDKLKATYDSNTGIVYIGLNPFNKKYYPSHSSVVGNSEIIIYEVTQVGTYANGENIMDCYMTVGDGSNRWEMGNATIFKFDSGFNVLERSIISSYGQVSITADRCSYIGVQGNFHHNMDIGGGIRYAYYDYPAIRFGRTRNDIQGYVETDNTVTDIYLTVNFNIPFIWAGSIYDTKMYFEENLPSNT